MPADICCCCWLSLAKKRRNKKNTVFLPQCLYQGSSATGMWFSGRFVIFLFPVPPLFFFSAMFVSGKFCDGYVVFRKICDFFYFLFLRFSSSPQCLCQGSSATGMWFSGRFVIFLFPVPPLFFFSAMFVSGKFCDGYVVFRKICDFFYFLFLRFSSSSQCLYQGSSATGMWFSGRFVIFLFPVPPLFFFFAMFVSGKFRNGYVVFRKICNFFISCSSAFLLLRNVCVREVLRRVCGFPEDL